MRARGGTRAARMNRCPPNARFGSVRRHVCRKRALGGATEREPSGRAGGWRDVGQRNDDVRSLEARMRELGAAAVSGDAVVFTT